MSRHDNWNAFFKHNAKCLQRTSSKISLNGSQGFYFVPTAKGPEVRKQAKNRRKSMLYM